MKDALSATGQPSPACYLAFGEGLEYCGRIVLVSRQPIHHQQERKIRTSRQLTPGICKRRSKAL